MNQSKQPFSENIWDEAETWSRDRLEAFQLDALRKQLARVGQRSKHYKESFAKTGFQPGDLKSLADLRQLPFSRKSDYVAGIVAEPPFGRHTAVEKGEAVRVPSGRTSGDRWPRPLPRGRGR